MGNSVIDIVPLSSPFIVGIIIKASAADKNITASIRKVNIHFSPFPKASHVQDGKLEIKPK